MCCDIYLCAHPQCTPAHLFFRSHASDTTVRTFVTGPLPRWLGGCQQVGSVCCVCASRRRCVAERGVCKARRKRLPGPPGYCGIGEWAKFNPLVAFSAFQSFRRRISHPHPANSTPQPLYNRLPTAWHSRRRWLCIIDRLEKIPIPPTVSNPRPTTLPTAGAPPAQWAHTRATTTKLTAARVYCRGGVRGRGNGDR